MAPRFCTNCGTALPEGAGFCPNCGTPTAPPPPIPVPFQTAPAGVIYPPPPPPPAAPAVTAQLSGWWRRVGAYFIDALIIVGATLPLYGLLVGIALAGGVKHVHSGGDFQFPYDDTDKDVYGNSYVVAHHVYHVAVAGWFWPIAIIGLLAVLAVQYGYAPFLMRREGRHNGQTFGRQATGIRVVKDTGEPIAFWFAVLREVVIKGFLIGAITIVPLLGWLAVILWFLWPLWDESNRAPQDMMLKTHVVRE